MSAPRVLVAGATGYLGRSTLSAFAAEGFTVRALTRRPSPPGWLAEAADEVVQGDVTRMGSLQGVCDGVDVVFSAVSASSGKGDFGEVDYRGNLNLLAEARRAGVRRFVYVSMFRGPDFRHLEVVAAHEDFVDALRKADIESCIIRPTGFFSDLMEILTMAKRGRVFLFGDGRNRLNPIDGRDLAVVCARHGRSDETEVNVGGPEVLDYRQIAEAAFAAVGKKTRISYVPKRVAGLAARGVRLLRPHEGAVLGFVAGITTSDLIAPATGEHRLADVFEDEVRAGRV